MRYWNAPPNNWTIRIQFLNDDVDGSLAPAALVGRPVDVVSGVLPSQRLDRQRNREFVNQPDAWGRAGAGQDGLSVFEPGDGQGQSAFDDGALQGQPLPGVQNDVAHRHQMRRVCSAISVDICRAKQIGETDLPMTMSWNDWRAESPPCWRASQL